MAQDSTTETNTSAIERGLLIVAAVTLGALLASRVIWADPPFLIWTDRDLYRASRVLVDWPTTGAEMNHGAGARVPGGLYLWVLAIPHALGLDALGLFKLMMAVEGLAIALLGAAVARLRGTFAGVVVALLAAAPSEARSATAWLWNPSFIIPIVAGATALLAHALRTDERRWLLPWALLLGLGATAHATVASWWAWSVVGLLVVRPAWTARRLGWLVGGFAVAYLPFLLGELFGGFQNFHLLNQQSPLHGSLGSRFVLRGESLLTTLKWIVPGGSTTTPGLLTAPFLLAAALGWLGSLTGPRPRDATRSLIAATGLATIAALLIPAIQAGLQVEWRYLLGALVGIGALGGYAVGQVADKLSGPGRTAWVAVCLVTAALPAALSVGQRQGWARQHHGSPSPAAYRFNSGRLPAFEELARGEGLTLSDLPGRLAILDDEDRGFAISQASPVDHELYHAGRPLQGSQPPPCLAIAPGERTIDADAIASALDWPPGSVTLLASTQLATGPTALRYSLEGGRCPTDLSSRYVDTPTEARMRPWWSQLRDGEVTVVDADADPVYVFRMMTMGSDGEEALSLMLGVTFATRGDTLVATLHSNQLRGHAYNGGWFQDGGVRAPALRLIAADGTVTRVAFYDDVVGPSGILAPLDTPIEVPAPGRYSVRLEGEAVYLSQAGKSWRERLGRSVPFDVLLTDDLQLPLRQ